jgi:hypothetical protein
VKGEEGWRQTNPNECDVGSNREKSAAGIDRRFPIDSSARAWNLSTSVRDSIECVDENHFGFRDSEFVPRLGEKAEGGDDDNIPRAD